MQMSGDRLKAWLNLAKQLAATHLGVTKYYSTMLPLKGEDMTNARQHA